MQEKACVLHVDGVAGMAGDMALGALVDLGVPAAELEASLRRLRLDGWRLRTEKVRRGGLVATRVVVETDEGDGTHDHADTHHSHAHAAHPHRGLREITGLVREADLPPRVAERAVSVFRRLCEAEAAVHGVGVDEVVLHEVGAVDAIVDVVGTCLGLEWLDVARVSASAPHVGGGMVRAAHGLLPVPGPATLRLLEGRSVVGGTAEVELLTPTGAALLTTLATAWGPMPAMDVVRCGFGAGTRDLADRPNVVRMTLGRPLDASPHPGEGSAVVEVVADVDDADPQVLAAACERALELGALDATRTPVVMKKGRLGTRLTLLCDATLREQLVDALFAETSTLGCRWRPVERATCERSFETVTTPWGPVRVKLARWKGRLVNARPEHDDCAALARTAGVPLKDVVAAAARLAPTRPQENPS